MSIFQPKHPLFTMTYFRNKNRQISKISPGMGAQSPKGYTKVKFDRDSMVFIANSVGDNAVTVTLLRNPNTFFSNV